MTEAILLPRILSTRIWEVLKELWISFFAPPPTVYTQDGEEAITDYTTGDASAPTDYFIGWGTGVVAADKADSALGTESAETRATASESKPVADKAQWVGTLTSLSTQTISEVGLFDAVTSGTLFIRKDFTGIDLETDDQIEFTITLEQT